VLYLSGAREITALAGFANLTVYGFIGDHLLRTLPDYLEISKYLIGTWSSWFHLSTGLVRLFDHYKVSVLSSNFTFYGCACL
jgi:hypothetical protein